MLDFVIVLFSIVSDAADFVGGALRQNSNFIVIVTCLKAMRAIRPLRLLKRATALRRVGWSLVMLVRSLGVSALFVAGIFYIFAIVGLNIFLGQFHYCSDALRDQGACTGPGRAWLNSDYNFDWAGSSFLTVVSLTSRDAWPALMLPGLSAMGASAAPVEWSQKPSLGFYLAVVIFWWILVSNIFIGVLTRAYAEGLDEFRRSQLFELQSLRVMRATVSGLPKTAQRAMSRTLREGDLNVDRHVKLLREDLPRVPDELDSSTRAAVLWFCSSRPFEVYMQVSRAPIARRAGGPPGGAADGDGGVGGGAGQVVSAGCACVYCFQTHAAGAAQRAVLATGDAFFLFCCGAEAVLRMWGLHPRPFFRSSWDTLNCVMVCPPPPPAPPLCARAVAAAVQAVCTCSSRLLAHRTRAIGFALRPSDSGRRGSGRFP